MIARDLCGRCGGCASFCSADEMNALEFDSVDGPRLINEDNCLNCGICYLICPQIEALGQIELAQVQVRGICRDCMKRPPKGRRRRKK